MGPKAGPQTAFWAFFAVMGPGDGPMTAYANLPSPDARGLRVSIGDTS